MRKLDYESPKVKEIDLSIRRSVCQNVSPNSDVLLDLDSERLSDDFDN